MYLSAAVCSFLFSQATLAFPHHQSRDAKGVLSLSFTRRSRDIEHKLPRDVFSAALSNSLLGYYIDVAVGTPAQQLSVLLDTGSADVWFYSSSVNCTTCTEEYYDETASSTAVIDSALPQFEENYQTPDSSISGYFVTDVLSVGGVSVTQIMGVATIAGSGDPPGGIMGISPSVDEGIVQENQSPFPGYIDTLVSSGVIKDRVYSVFFNGQYPEDSSEGTIIFGGYDNSKWTGDLITFPMIPPWSGGYQWLAVAGPAISVSDGQETDSVPTSATPYYVLLDTGTGLTYLPVDQYKVIAQALDLNITDNGQSVVSCQLRNAAGGFIYTFSGSNGEVAIEVPWQELVFEQDDTLPEGVCYFGIAPSSAQLYNDMELFTFGDTFLRSAYVLYNYDKSVIGLAQASYSKSSSKARAL